MNCRHMLSSLGLTAWRPLRAQPAGPALRASTLPEQDPATTVAERVLREAYRRIGRIAEALVETVGGYVTDPDGFLVDPADLG